MGIGFHLDDIEKEYFEKKSAEYFIQKPPEPKHKQERATTVVIGEKIRNSANS